MAGPETILAISALTAAGVSVGTAVQAQQDKRDAKSRAKKEAEQAKRQERVARLNAMQNLPKPKSRGSRLTLGPSNAANTKTTGVRGAT